MKVLYLPTNKKYTLYTTSKTNKKYIILNKRRVYLKDIQGKYRYITQSQMMDVDGDFSIIPDTYQGKPIFRKLIPKHSDNPDFHNAHLNELEIVKSLIANPQPNIVTIYQIIEKDDHWYYDAELLDINISPQNPINPLHIKQALEQLHQQGIIYIDLKEDNIGYSHKNKTWKIFDFDASGRTIDFKTWQHPPPPKWAAYKIALKQKHKLEEHWTQVDTIKYNFDDLRELDTITYNILFKNNKQ